MKKRLVICLSFVLILGALVAGDLVEVGGLPWVWAFQTARGQLELTVVDPQTGKPIPCRIHLRKSKGRPWHPDGFPFWQDHFVFPGQVSLTLPLGTYEFEIERGPEYAVRSGYFTIQRDSNDTKQVELPRFVHMASEGWYAGDLLTGRPEKDCDLLLEAEDLCLMVQAKPLGSSTLGNRAVRTGVDSPRRVHRPGFLIENSGGVYLFVPLDEVSDSIAEKRFSPQASASEKVSSTSAVPPFFFSDKSAFLPEAALLDLLEVRGDSKPEGRNRRWMDVVWPYCWDLPLWLALGQVDSIQVLHSHFRRNQWVDQEKEGKAREKARFPGRWGHGLWGQEIYFQVLQCGFRIPPSAGSGSGWAPNPVGYNRVYVHVEGPPRWETWWENFRQGRVLVTNGPLLRPKVQGKLPGHEFTAPMGEKVELDLALSFSTRERVQYLEIIQNGQVAHSISFEQYQKTGRLPKLVFTESGWFLIRALAETPTTYRFAMTGPYYVRIGPEPRISRSAVRFFLQWLQEREAMVQKNPPPADRRLLEAYQSARHFWEDLLRRTNAD